MQTGNTMTMGADRALYIGTLPSTGWHRHACPVLLIGLSGRFRLQLRRDQVLHCHSALIDTGVEHVFDAAGEQVALIYVEPDAAEAVSLRAQLAPQGGVMLDMARPVGSRSAIDGRLHTFDFQALLRPRLRTAPLLDPRVAAALAVLREPRVSPVSRQALAQACSLSPSRFNHLFSEQLGVSFREYRSWAQLRCAMRASASARSLTDAAMDAAFADAAHFSRRFRQTFGMTPSTVLRPLVRFDTV